MLKKTINYLSKPKSLAIVNAILVIIVILVNSFFQAFCRPTLWAAILLLICFLNTIVSPLLHKKTILFYFSNFISGISLGIFVYCIIFLGRFNYFGVFAIIFFGLGLVTYIPHFFAIQLCYKHLNGNANKLTKFIFCMGILTFLVTALQFGFAYKRAIESIDRFKKNNFTTLDRNFMTEKIMGMYFKYHTEICDYDGWRPPLHEPALVIGQWFNGRQDPLGLTWQQTDLHKRIELYKKFFPEQEIKYTCSCAMEYSDYYHNDELFKTP